MSEGNEESHEQEPQVVHAFAAGQEVVLADGTHAKVVAQSIDEAGNPVYEVVHAVRVTLPESALSSAS
jgi:hypothetical protein